MKIFCENTKLGLVPLYESDCEEKSKLKIGEIYYAEIKKPRNYEFHKKFFALIRLGHSNTQMEMPQEAYRAYVTMKAGYVDVYETREGKKMALPKSISFGNMEETEFQKLYESILFVIMKDLGVSQQNIEEELSSFM